MENLKFFGTLLSKALFIVAAGYYGNAIVDTKLSAFEGKLKELLKQLKTKQLKTKQPAGNSNSSAEFSSFESILIAVAAALGVGFMGWKLYEAEKALSKDLSDIDTELRQLKNMVSELDVKMCLAEESQDLANVALLVLCSSVDKGKETNTQSFTEI